MVTVTLAIENTYSLYPTQWTHPTVTVPAPPAKDTPEYDEWAWEQIYDHTGVGHTDGDSWYDVEVTASSHPDLLPVGAKFAFGY